VSNTSAPTFTVGGGYAVYRGPAADSAFHRHAAFQIAAAVNGEVTMLTDTGDRHQAPVLLVTPMTRHRLLATTDLRTFYIEPHCRAADRLRRLGTTGIVAAPELLTFSEDDLLHPHLPAAKLDPRLTQAMRMLLEHNLAMPDLAATVGLSAPRLRALAHQQIGMPLTRWRVWARLRRAAEALGEGQPLAQAAIIAGFADQAHLTRWMREMIGLTPAAVAPVLRGQGRRAT
jgi:AraC-like DNA-binding protein